MKWICTHCGHVMINPPQDGNTSEGENDSWRIIQESSSNPSKEQDILIEIYYKS